MRLTEFFGPIQLNKTKSLSLHLLLLTHFRETPEAEILSPDTTRRNMIFYLVIVSQFKIKNHFYLKRVITVSASFYLFFANFLNTGPVVLAKLFMYQFPL